MAFFQAFTDDSAAQTGDKRLFLAGYLHRADIWAEFSENWSAELKASPAIEYFKASEANNLSGQFDYKVGWSEAKRNAKIGKLTEIISYYKPFSFEFSINRKLFEDELKPVSPYGLGHPHFPMCFAVVAGISRYVAQVGISVPIEFVFDEQEGVDDDITMFFSEMKKSLPIEAQKLIDGKPIFKNDRDHRYLPLQAADLLAWHLRKKHETGVERPLLDKLVNQTAHLVQEIPDEMVMIWADHHNNQPGIELTKSKGQWRKFRNEVQRLKAAGIDPAKIKGAGVYYPEGTPMIAKIIDRVRRLFRNR